MNGQKEFYIITLSWNGSPETNTDFIGFIRKLRIKWSVNTALITKQIFDYQASELSLKGEEVASKSTAAGAAALAATAAEGVAAANRAEALRRTRSTTGPTWAARCRWKTLEIRSK